MTLCNNIFTSRGKQKLFLCDYCKKTFDKHEMKEIKGRNLTGGTWRDSQPGIWWFHKYVCKNCFSMKIYVSD